MWQAYILGKILLFWLKEASKKERQAYCKHNKHKLLALNPMSKTKCLELLSSQ